MSDNAKRVPLIEQAAREIIPTFEHVSQEAHALLKARRISGADVLASVNTLTSGRGLTSVESSLQEHRDSLLILSKEPAIARVRVKDQNGDESTIFICRTTPASNSPAFASNRSRLGRLAALPVGDELDVGRRTLVVLEKEKLRPIFKADQWDAENTEFEALDAGVFTVEYLRPFLGALLPVEEAPDLLSRILADERIKLGIVEGRRHSIITKMSLRDQPILDQFQDEIFRLPLGKRLLLIGPAGTGKTTTLIRRLGQKLDTAYLESEEAELAQAISSSGALPHRDSWLMFTPTELLKQYLKEAFAKEGVPASDERITTWDDFSRHLARNVFNVLRSANSRSGFVLKMSASYLTRDVHVASFEMFREFFSWHVHRYLSGLHDAAEELSRSADPDAAALGKILLGVIPNAQDHYSIASVMSSLHSLSFQVATFIAGLRSQTDAILNNALNRELGRNREFLVQLGQFITSVQAADADDADEDDDPEAEEEEVPPLQTGIMTAATAFRRAMRAYARASVGGRPPQSTSINAQIIRWLGDRILNPEDASKAGMRFLMQDAARHFSNPARRYLRRIPLSYRRFRRLQSEPSRWYSRAAPAIEIAPLELDVVLLAILNAGSEMLNLVSIWSNLADPFWSSLRPINDLYRNQILIDEATDFASAQLGCIAALANPRIRSVFACGDFNQRMTVWGTRSLEEVQTVLPDVEVRRITTTYRQSRSLNELARAIVEAFGGGGDVATLPADMDFDGESPALIENCSDRATLVAWIADRIREIERFVGKLPSIAVFVKDDSEIPSLADALGRALGDSNIQVEACLGGKAVGQETDVRVFAVEHIKGLEFESVIFVGVDRLMEAYPDLFDKYLYVGATRAATYLGLSCENALPLALDPLRPMFVANWAQRRDL